MKAKYIAILASILSFVACNIQEESLNDPSGVVSFHAVNGDVQDTKTVLQSDGNLLWSAKDKIDIFVGAQSFEFTGTNTSAVSEATFIGSLDGVDWSSGKEYWAVYPHSANNSSDGLSMTVSLPAEQEACAGTFAKDLFISIAKSQDYDLAFYNVCGGIKFSVTEVGVESVTFKGNNGEAIAGTAKVAFDQNGKPIVQEVSNPLSEITLSAPTGTTLEVGKWYYIVCFPSVLQNGYAMTLKKEDGSIAEKKGESAVTIKRAIWGRLTEMDKDLSYTIPSNEIWYTSVNGVVVNPYSECEWIKNDMIVSNTVSNGKGKIVFKDDITGICDHAFSECTSLTSITIPESVTSIEKYAFYYCKSLATIIIPEDVTSIGEKAFAGCKGLLSIIIPDSVKSIGNSAFANCTSLASITIPDSVTSIGTAAFASCTSLTSVAIPYGIKTILIETFYECTSLTSITIPESVTSIGEKAFYYCTSLASITIPDSVKWIEDYAFSHCTSLTSIIIPESVTSVWSGAFSDCTSLTSIIIQEGVTSIGAKAFSGCKSLAFIIIPESVTKIGTYAFYGCSGLTSIIVNAANPPTGAQYMFESTNNCPIYVPGRSLETYKTADVWITYADRIKPIPPEAIDLGLSVKWASFNLGANSPEEYGDYYAWGETEPKTTYSWSTYLFSNNYSGPFSKYNTNSSFGTLDNKTVLEPEDDAAKKIFGEYWRIPTDEEWGELIAQCTWKALKQNGIYGIKFTGPNGNSIFLPTAGSRTGTNLSNAGTIGYYWSSSLTTDKERPYGALSSRIGSDVVYRGSASRCDGLSVRPVYGDYIRVTGIQLNQSNLELVVGETITLTATVSPDNAMYKTLTWSSSDPNIVSVDNNGEVTAISEGTASISAKTIDGGFSATCSINVNPAPITDFNENSYLIWKQNSNGGWDAKYENYRRYESYLDGFVATVVEMKFQLASSSEAYSALASTNSARDNYKLMSISNTELKWMHVWEEDTDDVASINLNDAGVTRTSLITLRFDGTTKTLTINGKSYSVPFSSFSFTYLFAEYFREYDEGEWKEFMGIPSGSKIYYVKGWDSKGNISYLGYPTRAVNPKSSVEEYCWYTYYNKKTTYQFAYNSANQGGFGGYIP